MSVHVAFALSCFVSLSAAPLQLQEFRMAARIEHFDITCPPEFDRQAAIIGSHTETAYQRVSSSLQHDLSFRPLLVLFTGLDALLVHELSHVFLFDVLPLVFTAMFLCGFSKVSQRTSAAFGK